MAGASRDWDRITENAALLGAQVAGYSVPISPALDIFRAFRAQGSAEDEAFVHRLIAQLRFCGGLS